MCLIFKLCDGRFVVVDSGVGGRDNDGSSSGWVYASLAKHAKDPNNIQVAAWVITHIHSDHAGGLVDMARGTYNTTLKKDGEQVRTHNVMPRNVKSMIKIDTIIYNQPKKNVDGRDGWMNEIITAFNVKNVVRAHPGQVFYFGNCKFTMYGSLDLVAEKTISNHNDESLSMMFEFNGKKLLVLGDAYPQNTKALATIYKESLKADIVQNSHHGYDNTDAAQVYKYVQATMVIWPVASYEMGQCDLKNANVNAIFKSIPDNMQFAPHGGNIDFDENWKASKTYRVFNSIPYCDCSFCKKNNRKTKSSNF
jgi:mRNA degradation ribonuclease J1/J2